MSEISDLLERRIKWLKTSEGKQWSREWWKEYIQKEEKRQKEIDNDPNVETLYTYEINIDTLRIQQGEEKVLDYDESVTGFAEYEESTQSCRVYAESLISSEHAKQLVLDFCKRFMECVKTIESY